MKKIVTSGYKKIAQPFYGMGGKHRKWESPGSHTIEVGEHNGVWIDGQTDQPLPELVSRELQPYANANGFLELSINFTSKGGHVPAVGLTGPMDHSEPAQDWDDREAESVDVLSSGDHDGTGVHTTKKIGELSSEAAQLLGEMYQEDIDMVDDVDTNPEPPEEW